MIEIDLTLTNANAIGSVEKQIENIRKLLTDVLPKARDAHNDTTLAPYQVAPGSVKYPIQWASPKQRRAFFATNGFGRGIPTVRTNDLQKAWRLVLNTTDGEASFSAVNDSGYEQFVTGAAQQPFHTATGWYQSNALAEQQGKTLGAQVTTDIVNAWATQK